MKTKLRVLMGCAAVALVTMLLLVSSIGGQQDDEVTPALRSATGFTTVGDRKSLSPARVTQVDTAAPPASSSLAREHTPPVGAEQSYERVPDLYRFAMEALDSNDRLRLVSAWHAARECRLIQDDAAMLSQLSHAADAADAGPRERAAKALMVRCKGFLDNDPAANLEFRARVASKLDLLDPHGMIPGRGDVLTTQRQMQRILDTQDWITFIESSPEIMQALAKRQGIKPASPDEVALGAGLVVAACRIGKDCSTDSLGFLVRCAVHGRCDLQPYELGQSVPPELHPRIRVIAEEVSSAFRSRDAAYFGLPRSVSR